MRLVPVAMLLSVYTTLTSSGLSHAHDGGLDPYGCHQNTEQRNYHCHDGMLKGGSFDSRREMLQRLKRQLETLGRPWPYGDLIEEDITSPKPKLEEQP